MSDSREVAHREPEQPMVRQSDNLLAQVIAAAKDPTVDAEKMKTLAELVNGQQDRERENEFNRDLNAAIMEMPVVTRQGEIIIPANRTKNTPERKQGRFARFEDIDRVCRPILARHNLAIRFDVGTSEAQSGPSGDDRSAPPPPAITVRPIITHANGYTHMGDAMRMPADTSGSKNAAQAVGSAVQYAKRYAYCAALNIVTEGIDDDGRGGVKEVLLPFEREQLVLTQAGQAFDENRYIEWFAQQSPKDRAWLIQTGKHVEFGGQPMLTSGGAPEQTRRESGRSASSSAPVREPTPEPEPEPEPDPVVDTGGTGGEPPVKRTPEQMVEDFKKRIDECTASRTVVDLQAEPRVLVWMEKLERQHPDLHQSITDHAARKYSTLVAAERDAKRRGENLL